MKTLFRTRSLWILVLAPILAAVLLIFGYSAIATARRAAAVSARPDVTHAPPKEGEPKQIQNRREFLNRFYGTGRGQVSQANFAASLATARALPPSPLLRDKSVVSGSQQNWTYPVPPPMNWVGDTPTGVRIDAIAVHPVYEDTVYVGSEGGLAKSTDGGGTWTILSDGLLSQSIRSIAIDPGDPEIVYVGTGTGHGFGVGIYRSDDGGESWDLISGSVESSPFTGKGVVKIVVDPNTAGSTTTTTVYASVIYRDEKGTSWHVFWRSTDSGSTWDDFKKASPAGGEPFGFYDIALNPDNPSQVYITAPDGVFMRDAWGAYDDWLQIHDQLPNPGDPSCLVFAYTNPWALLAELFLAYQQGNDTKIYKSESPSYSTWDLVGSTGGNVFFLGIDPVHPNRIFVGGYGQLRYSMNGGSTWLAAGNNVHVDQHSIAFCPSDADRHYLGNDGGVYRADYPTSTATPSPTMTWENKNQNLPGILTQGVSIGRDDRLFIGTQDNAHQLSTPAYPAWRLVLAYDTQLNATLLGGDGAIPFIEVENNIEKIYAVTYTVVPPVIGPDNGFPCRIIQGEVDSITPPDGVGEFSTIYPAMSVEFKSQSNSDRIIMGFQNVWRSTDSGDNWTRIGGTSCPSPQSSVTCGIDPGNGSNIEVGRIAAVYEAPGDWSYIYAITLRLSSGQTKVFRTANAEDGPDADWEDVTNNLPDGINALAVHPEDPLTVYLTGGSHVYKTIDGGDGLWVTEDVGPDFIFRDVAFHPDDPETILVASHRGVFARVDDEWGSLNANLPAGMAVVNLSFNPTSHQLAISTYGRGVYVLDLDRDPPKTVSIGPPANGAFLRGTVTVGGTFEDNHLLAGVQFKIDGSNLYAEDTTAPYSISWNTSAWAGSRTLTAVARDAYGNTATSAAVTVTVDNTEPTVSIREPEESQKVSGTVTISANASDNIGVAGVQFTLDGNALDAEDTSSPFSIEWDASLENGEHILTAKARDAAGNITESEAVTVDVSN